MDICNSSNFYNENLISLCILIAIWTFPLSITFYAHSFLLMMCGLWFEFVVDGCSVSNGWFASISCHCNFFCSSLINVFASRLLYTRITTYYLYSMIFCVIHVWSSSLPMPSLVCTFLITFGVRNLLVFCCNLCTYMMWFIGYVDVDHHACWLCWTVALS